MRGHRGAYRSGTNSNVVPDRHREKRDDGDFEVGVFPDLFAESLPLPRAVPWLRWSCSSPLRRRSVVPRRCSYTRSYSHSYRPRGSFVAHKVGTKEQEARGTENPQARPSHARPAAAAWLSNGNFPIACREVNGLRRFKIKCVKVG